MQSCPFLRREITAGEVLILGHARILRETAAFDNEQIRASGSWLGLHTH
jgi:hypothetical protein